jgi:hypothetical protein
VIATLPARSQIHHENIFSYARLGKNTQSLAVKRMFVVVVVVVATISDMEQLVLNSTPVYNFPAKYEPVSIMFVLRPVYTFCCDLYGIAIFFF